jgi:hypothetical protein
MKAQNIDSTVCLNAEGSGGRDAYTIIQSVLGPKSIESGDFPQVKHPCHEDFQHIQQDTDNIVGNHFVFYMHRELDCDPTNDDKSDRQRCEIKVHNGSAKNLKGYKGTTFTYSWRFKINEGMTVSKSFTHLFQLKGVGGDNIDHPIVTITGAKVNGSDKIQVRWSPLKEGTILDDNNWSSAKGLWLDVYCQAKFDPDGFLTLTVKKPDGTLLLDVRKSNLDMWRDRADFVRPKWGIYRSLKYKENLRRDEETVRFANFSITNGDTPSRSCSGGG